MQQAFAWSSFVSGRPSLDPRSFMAVLSRTGVEGVEGLPRQLWPIAQDLGLVVLSVRGHDETEVNFDDLVEQPYLAATVRSRTELAAESGVALVFVCAYETRVGGCEDSTAAAISQLAPLADGAVAAGVRLLLEMRSGSARTLEIVRQVGSPGLHAMHDLSRDAAMPTFAEHGELIGHIRSGARSNGRTPRTAPELSWPTLARHLDKAGYDGWISHRLVRHQDPINALSAAVEAFRVRSVEQTTTTRKSR